MHLLAFVMTSCNPEMVLALTVKGWDSSQMVFISVFLRYSYIYIFFNCKLIHLHCKTIKSTDTGDTGPDVATTGSDLPECMWASGDLESHGPGLHECCGRLEICITDNFFTQEASLGAICLFHTAKFPCFASKIFKMLRYKLLVTYLLVWEPSHPLYQPDDLCKASCGLASLHLSNSVSHRIKADKPCVWAPPQELLLSAPSWCSHWGATLGCL